MGPPEALHRADLGQRRPLLAFFLDRGIDTLQLVINHLLTVEAPGAESIAARIRLINDVARKLLAAAKEQIGYQFENLNLPSYLGSIFSWRIWAGGERPVPSCFACSKQTAATTTSKPGSRTFTRRSARACGCVWRTGAADCSAAC